MKIGILALQGAFIEHKHSLDALGVESFEIRQKKDIEKPFDGLIIPGGESTVIGKLLHKLDLYEPIKNMIENGMPVFGTCAGLIVLARDAADVRGQALLVGGRTGGGRGVHAVRQSGLVRRIAAGGIGLLLSTAHQQRCHHQNSQQTGKNFLHS